MTFPRFQLCAVLVNMYNSYEHIFHDVTTVFYSIVIDSIKCLPASTNFNPQWNLKKLKKLTSKQHINKH